MPLCQLSVITEDFGDEPGGMNEFLNNFPLPTAVVHVHFTVGVIKWEMYVDESAPNVFTSLNHPGNSTVLALRVCNPSFEANSQ